MEELLRYWMRWPSVEHLIYRYLWVWGVAQSLHFVGMALLIGTVGILDLRLLGMAKEFRVAAIKKLIPWGVFGFVLCLTTGLLFVTGIYANINIHPYVVLKSDVFLQLKLGFVVLAGINLLAFYATGMSRAVDRLEAGEEAPPLAKFFAGASLCIWIAVMYFARLIPSGKFQP
jgi:hypothetical protein